MATISLCMIVKNEALVLERCLNSLQGIVDEMIIVDTGSEDQTKEIAGRYTEHLYDFAWQDDFSAARNFSFSKATMEYIYTADADEVLDEVNRKRFMDLKRALLPEIDIVQMLYCNQLTYNTTYNFDEEYRPKLYKRLRSFCWEEPVHERVRLEPVIFDSEIRVLHCPTSNHGSRDFRVFQKCIKNQGGLSRHLHEMYARELLIAGTESDFLEAEAYFKAEVSNPQRSGDEVKEAACILTRAARIRRDAVGMLKYTAKALCAGAPSEICFELGEYYKAMGEYDEAILWYYNAAYETDSILSLKHGRELPMEGLIACYEALGQRKMAAEYRRELEAL